METPCDQSPTLVEDHIHPEIFPLCAVTRSQTPPVEDTVPDTFDLPNQIMSQENLIKAQQEDPTLQPFHRLSVSSKEEVDHFPGFYYHKGVLMRCHRPPTRTDSDTWAEVHQVVVPKSIRIKVMEIAHDGSGGHLGVCKTYSKISENFFWPGLKQTIVDFIRTCHTCQLSGKPNQRIPKAPLNPIPVAGEPFEKVLIDCVGPLPKTKKGNQYILTLMCPVTRYPEAFPLKKINAQNIANTLLKFFTQVGLPKEIQSDRGSNFTSDLFKNVLKELDITQTLSTAYHPESQGALERFHQTIKAMLRKFCNSSISDWDDGLPLMLFAIRESVQESLGYSPFELLYGRQVRGPLKVLKNQWYQETPEYPKQTVNQYIDNLKQKLKTVRSIALENLRKSQTKMKLKYDQKVKVREFKAGDEVLLYLPIPGAPLSHKFQGPYIVSHRLNKLNYVVFTPDRRKQQQLVHINLMKKYCRRDPADALQRPVACILPEMNGNINNYVEIANLKNNSCILADLAHYLTHLTPTQQDDIHTLLNKYPMVVTDRPGLCKTTEHDIKLIDLVNPIRQAPYRLNPHKFEIMKKEVDYLLENGLAEPSCSPWASPSLLVPKEGGDWRFCTDYRKLNAVTVKDSYPLPQIDMLIDRVGKSKFLTKIDLIKGYHQIKLTKRAQDISSFITPFGLFSYLVLPFGLCNAPATFQRAINETIAGLCNTYAYLDDILILADTWEEHVNLLDAFLERLSTTGFVANLSKSVFGGATVTYLGHVVGDGQCRPKTANVEAILEFPTPHNRKSLQRFLGMAGYYRRFCRNFSAIAAPLTSLTSPKVKFVWTPTCQSSFDALKQFLVNQPVLQAPDYSRPFVLQVDACGEGIGAVLLQSNDSSQALHPVCYYSAKLLPYQRAYSTVEKEALALVSSFKHFECYLSVPGYQTLVFSDHNPLTFIEKARLTNQRILRWALTLQAFNFRMAHIKGEDNIIADTLSRGATTTPSVAVIC